MAAFRATTSAQGDRVVVSLAGECDLSVRDEVSAVLSAAIGRGRVVVVDLGDLQFLDSTGLHALVSAHQAARARGGYVYADHATGAVATVLEVTGVGDLLSPPAPRDA